MNNAREVCVTAIGTAVPYCKQHQDEIVNFISERLKLTPSKKRRLQMLYRASGVEHRHTVIQDYQKTPSEFTFFSTEEKSSLPGTQRRMAVYQEQALPLAVQAIQNCFSDETNSFEKVAVTHLITVSCTGMYAPGLDVELLGALGLPSTVHRMAINFMGCYGAFTALKTAYHICKADPHAKVLVVCVELCSLHVQNLDTLDRVLSSAIFSDGAGAVLVTSQDNTENALQLKGFYCDILPDTQKDMAWQITDAGFDIVLSKYVSQLVEVGIDKFLQQALTYYQVARENLNYYAIHPGGVNILKACEKSLKISSEENAIAYEVLRNFGNMSSATILFVLKNLWEDLKNKSQKGNIFSCAFGPGLTLESMLLCIR